MRGRGWWVALVGTAVLVATAGCGGGGGSDAVAGTPAPSLAPAASSGSSASSSGAASGEPVSSSAVTSRAVTSSAVTPAPTPSGTVPVVVPVAVVPVTGTGTALDGATIATVQVTVGGGAPVTVRLDTGSSGLLLDKSLAGSGTTDTGKSIGVQFGGSTASGTLGQATVSLGGITTAAPIGVTLVDVGAGAPDTFAGTHGLLGVGTANSPTSVFDEAFAPTLQLPAPADQGATVDLAAGTMTLGPVTAADGAVVLPMTKMTGSPSTYSNGAQGYDRLVQLCWTVGSAAANCAPTDVDLGSPVIGLNATTFTSLGGMNSIRPAGEAISVAAPAGLALFSTTSAAAPSPDTLLLTGLGEATYNTGIALFQHAVVGIDYVGGRIVVTPAS